MREPSSSEQQRIRNCFDYTVNIIVSASARFMTTPDGRMWTSNPTLAYSFWLRYLDTFEGVELICRAAPCLVPPDGHVEVTGPNIFATTLPDFTGFGGFIKNLPQLCRIIQKATFSDKAFQLRLPCMVGYVGLLICGR